MMDTSIPIIPPSLHRQRGADAFDRGVSIDDHHMKPGAPAIADWRKGWLERQAQVGALCVLAAAIGMTPP